MSYLDMARAEIHDEQGLNKEYELWRTELEAEGQELLDNLELVLKNNMRVFERELVSLKSRSAAGMRGYEDLADIKTDEYAAKLANQAKNKLMSMLSLAGAKLKCALA